MPTLAPGSAAMAAEVELAMSDLVGDANGEIVFFNDSGLRRLAIATDAAVVADGRAGAHRTAAGQDVSGFRFVTFDNGLTLYYQTAWTLVRRAARPLVAASRSRRSDASGWPRIAQALELAQLLRRQAVQQLAQLLAGRALARRRHQLQAIGQPQHDPHVVVGHRQVDRPVHGVAQPGQPLLGPHLAELLDPGPGTADRGCACATAGCASSRASGDDGERFAIGEQLGGETPVGTARRGALAGLGGSGHVVDLRLSPGKRGAEPTRASAFI